jgi:hypothetical protein
MGRSDPAKIMRFGLLLGLTIGVLGTLAVQTLIR